MPELAPFAGLRPRPAVTGPLDQVVCPPYDVISAEQRAALVALSAYNAVRVELPDGDYQGAALLLQRWQSEGAYTVDETPALYGYRMTHGTGAVRRRTTGVIGALALEPPGRGILPHEQTTPKAKSDRLELLRAARANTSPIWCLCTEAGLTSALGDPPGTEGPASARDEEGTLHELWPIVDPERAATVSSLVAAAPLLVADGHHRYETALAYQAETGPGGGADAVLALVVELSDDHLEVLAIHRTITGLPSGTDVAAQLETSFTLRPARRPPAELRAEMVAEGGLGLVTAAGRWVAVPLAGGAAGGLALDSNRADAALGLLPPHTLTYEHDVDRALAEVDSGRADAAVLCRPATVPQIAATARGGERMPPKTTFFWPKPRTGLLFRLLPPAASG
jgi:uncharacterized protein (DUF1015 family)